MSESAVHESRIETRRMLAHLELLRRLIQPKRLEQVRRRLKHHLDALDALRDTHVQLGFLNSRLRRHSGANTFSQVLRQEEKSCLKAAKRRLGHLKVRRLKKVVRALEKDLRRAARDPKRMEQDRRRVVRAVDQAFGRTLARRQRIDPKDVATIHRTRVAFRKFRYMIEVLRPVLRQITPRRLAALRTCQRVMGELQDTDVFLARLEKFARKRPAQARALTPLHLRLQQIRQAQIRRCLKQVAGLDRFWSPACMSTKTPPPPEWKPR